jgi:hypothetical protein
MGAACLAPTTNGITFVKPFGAFVGPRACLIVLLGLELIMTAAVGAATQISLCFHVPVHAPSTKS